MAFTDYLGKALDIKKPDGTDVLDIAGKIGLSIGNVSSVTGLKIPTATDFLKNGASSTLTDNKTTAGASKKNLPAVVQNPMEQFASVNVLWTLACLTPQQYNNPSSYRNSPQALENIVFSSGGRFDSQRVKTLFGTPEYYVNNFQMNCIIGSSSQTGNSNAVKFSFDIYEPYSMGLLLQSMQNAAVKAGYLSYLDNTPYVLRMDIQGYDDVGIIIKTVKPKFFTLKLTSMKFSVTEGGSTYKVEAIPYNHQGFSDAINTTYNDLKISGEPNGTGSVAELLSTGQTSLVAVLNDNEEKLKKEGRIGITDEYSIQFPQLASNWYSSAGAAPAINKATASLMPKPVQEVGGSAVKKTDPADMPMNSIGTASLGFDQLRGGDPIFKRAGDQIDSKTGVVKRDNMTIDPKVRAFQFGQGQSLTAIINQVVLSSDYAKKAITDKPTPEGYIKWFKLDVQVELKEYDPIVGDYAKKITYRIVPYFIHQSIFSNPSSAPFGYAELMKTVSKEYNYIYTGQNVDILKFDININNLFYTGTNPKPENERGMTSNQDQNFGEKLNPTTSTGKGDAPAAQAAQMGRARPKRDPKLLAAYKGGASNKSVEQNVAENFQQAFISGNSADLVTVDLEILGDPYWLVDSGIGNYFSSAASPTAQITNDGTMNYESGSIYVYLTFKTPADINEGTGLYDFSVAGKESPFGGIYRVNMVENYFQDGFWKQKLKCLRMPGPQGPEAAQTTSGEPPLTVSPTNNSTTEIGKTEPPKTSPTDDINKTNDVSGGADPSTNPNKGGSSGGTRTTSNQAQPRAGYRYYRDLGQN